MRRAFDAAVAAASATLARRRRVYDPEVFIDYTRRIIEGMGGSGAGADAAARDLYDEWSACHHFTLYEEVPEVLRALHADGFTIGLISNTQRSPDDVRDALRARWPVRRSRSPRPTMAT